MAENISEVDIIFVGGGSAACVAAGRLAASNPGLEILLVEQGPNNLDDPTVVTPALMLSHLVPETKHALFWEGNASTALNGRKSIVPSGGMLGGGSSINFLMYARASASDFDDWDTDGWRPNDLLPLLRKMETYHVEPGRDTHGYNGPLHISYSNYYAAIGQEYLDVSVRKGVPLADDIMDMKTGHGCQRLAKWIDPTTGRRQDAAHRYIHPQASNKFLHVMTKTKVVRVIFEGTKATGVEVVANEAQEPGADQTPRTITARRLVVVSAGAIASPVILQRSGVGAADRLAKAGVKTLVNLPGVGAEYQDHAGLILTFHVADDTETLNAIMDKETGAMDKHLALFENGQGFLTLNLSDAGSKLRPTQDELQAMGPAFQETWKQQFERAPDKPVAMQILVNGFMGPPSLIPANSRFMMMANIATYPLSRGHIYLNSADHQAAPDFRPGTIEEQSDIDVQIWIYKKSREIARRMPSFRGEFAPLHPKFPEGSAATCVRLDGPPPADMENLAYTAEDNAAIEEFIRDRSDTIWHSIGTVPMKAEKQGGCVDPRLNVYGTTNLKVADLSILPGNVGANTNSTAMLVGEKAAVLIAEDLNLILP
ncbi:alcohol oxidase [Ceratobasidium sp. AG-I]|nr:alcohol oxidase [Ceratobasidium sp. AG-I]